MFAVRWLLYEQVISYITDKWLFQMITYWELFLMQAYSVNDNWHNCYLYDFSPVWVLIDLFRWLLCANDFWKTSVVFHPHGSTQASLTLLQ